MGSVCIYHERSSQKCRLNQFVREKKKRVKRTRRMTNQMKTIDLFGELLFLRAGKE